MSLILDGTAGLFGNVTGGDISGNFIGLNGNGSSLTVTATGSTTARSLANRFADVVNVKNFGAIGDGASHPLSSVYSTLAQAQAVYPFVTSLTQELDWAAIQAALNTQKSVYFGDNSNTYLITSDLVIYSNCKYFANGATIYQQNILEEIFTGDNINNSEISGFVLRGASPVPLVADGFNRAIEIAAPRYLTIENNIIENWGAGGIFLTKRTLTSGAEGCYINNNIIKNTGDGILIYIGGEGNVITNNRIYDSGRTGIFLDDISLSDTTSSPDVVKHTIVSNNFITRYGIVATGAGITTGHIIFCSISNNVITFGDGDAISIFAGGNSTQPPQVSVGVSIDANVISNIGGNGIALTGAIYNNIQNNIIYGPQLDVTPGAHSGIFLTSITRNATTESSSFNLITNNFIFKATGDLDYGIWMQTGCNSNVVEANYILNSTTFGVYDEGSSNVVKLNQGWITENKGSGTITSPASTVTINHGCNFTPTAGEINIIFTSSISPATNFIVTGTTSTQFTVQLSASPTSPAAFSWAISKI